MTKNEMDSLAIGDKILCHINQTTYEIIGIDNSRHFGRGFDLESPDGYYRYASRGDASREFQLVNDQGED